MDKILIICLICCVFAENLDKPLFHTSVVTTKNSYPSGRSKQK